MSERRAHVQAQVAELRIVRQGIIDLLPADVVAGMDELMDNEEPNEALLNLAWAVARYRIIVPRSVLDYIERSVGNPAELPRDLTDRSNRRGTRG